jgi:hypothetical protein
MSNPEENGVPSNNMNTVSQSLPHSSTLRPNKIQKLQIPNQSQFGYYTTPQHPFGEGTSNLQQNLDQEDSPPAQNKPDQYQENLQEEISPEPFFYYQEAHVQDSINQCKNSILGKVLSEKPISIQVLHNSLSGIWCNPSGFKISELEGKILQIRMDKEEDMQGILKGSPWIIRNCWLILHN